MLKALGRVRTKERLFEPGEKIASLPKKEEDWLISIGMAERIADPEPTKTEEKAESKKPTKSKKKAKSSK